MFSVPEFGLIATDSSLWLTAVFVFFGTLLFLSLKSVWVGKRTVTTLTEELSIGDVTLEELRKYNGRDPFLPILFSVRGTVYDVSKGSDFYGPGGGYAIFAGREVSRALGLMSLSEEDCTAKLEDLSAKQLQTLDDWESKFKTKYPVVGKVVAPRSLSLAELQEFNGSNRNKPIYLAIRGIIFDVSKGRQFYGPDGIYPFAGHECARAFALLSTDTADCTDNLEGLHKMELDSLRDWEDKFYSKYRVIGRIRKEQNE